MTSTSTTTSGNTSRWLRRSRHSLAAGVAMTVGGTIALIWSIYLVRGTVDWTRVVGSVSMLVIICGVVMGGVALLALKGRSIEEAYTLGYDVGYEKGYRAGQRHLLAACPLPVASCRLKTADLDDPESIVTIIDEEA